MTVDEIYQQTIELTEDDRERLIGLIVSDLDTHPNTITSRDHLISELNASASSPLHKVTDETWDSIKSEIFRHSQRHNNA